MYYSVRILGVGNPKMPLPESVIYYSLLQSYWNAGNWKLIKESLLLQLCNQLEKLSRGTQKLIGFPKLSLLFADTGKIPSSISAKSKNACEQTGKLLMQFLGTEKGQLHLLFHTELETFTFQLRLPQTHQKPYSGFVSSGQTLGFFPSPRFRNETQMHEVRVLK